MPSQKVEYNLAQVSVYKCYLGLLQRPHSPYFLLGQYPSFRRVRTNPVLAVVDVARTSHTTQPGASEGKRMVVKVPIVNRQQQIDCPKVVGPIFNTTNITKVSVYRFIKIRTQTEKN